MRISAALIIPALLCTTATAARPARVEAYHAVGTEPFWSLTIDGTRMYYRAAGGRTIVARTPRVIHGFAGETYRTPRLSVNVVHAPCSDGMSDRTYRDTVSVTTRSTIVRGCGGGIATDRTRHGN